MKEWPFLIGAIVLETFATTMLKYSEQFTKILPTVAMAVGYLLSFYCLSHALRTMPTALPTPFGVPSAFGRYQSRVFSLSYQASSESFW